MPRVRYVTVFVTVLMMLMSVCYAPVQAASGITFVPGTVAVDAAVQDALSVALQTATAADMGGASYFAITAVQGAEARANPCAGNAATVPCVIPFDSRTVGSISRLPGSWAFVSIAGFTQLLDGSQSSYGLWSLENAVWVGLALVMSNPDGSWSSTLKGQPGFETLLARVPSGDLDAEARAGLLPNHRPLTPEETTYRFPWQPGTKMYYGFLGVHAGGYPSRGTFKAVDFLSDGNTALGHAPNKLLASASGTISYVCAGITNTAIQIGNLMYLHLVSNPPNPNLVIGHAFQQGAMIGQLQTGQFSDPCGYGYQGASWFHVHWSFSSALTTAGTFQAGGWTLNLADQIWRRGNATVVTQTWMLADFIKYTFIPFETN